MTSPNQQEHKRIEEVAATNRRTGRDAFEPTKRAAWWRVLVFPIPVATVAAAAVAVALWMPPGVGDGMLVLASLALAAVSVPNLDN